MTVDNFSLALVIGLAVIDGTLAIAARTFTRASAAAVLTPAGLLREGNAIINVGFTIAGAAGPAIAGVVVAALGVQTALLVDAGSFVVVAAMLAADPRRCPRSKRSPSRGRAACARASRTCAAARCCCGCLRCRRSRSCSSRSCCRSRSCTRRRRSTPGDSGYGALLSVVGRRHGRREPRVRGRRTARVAAGRSCSSARR